MEQEKSNEVVNNRVKAIICLPFVLLVAYFVIKFVESEISIDIEKAPVVEVK